MAGDAVTGVSLMRLVAELDAGPVCADRARSRSTPDDDYGTLSARLAALAGAAAGRGARAAARVRRAGRRRASPTPRRSRPPTACSTRGAAGRRAGARRCGRCTRTSARASRRARRAAGARSPSRPTPAGELAAQDGRLYYGATPGHARAAARPARRAGGRWTRRRICAVMPSEARASPPTPCCGGPSSRGRSPIARFTARRAALTARDRALAMHLAYGAVQRVLTLDHLIEQASGRARRARSTRRCWPLCASAATSCASPAAPPHAVVNDAVELAKAGARARARQRGAAAALARGRGAARRRSRDEDPAGASIVHSMPRWIVERWWETLGARATRALLARCNEPAESALRANTLRTDAAGARRLAGGARGEGGGERASRPRRWSRSSPSTRTARRCGATGALMPQSRASMMVAHCLDAAARRARARPVRRPGRQDDARRRADGGPRRDRRGRAPRRACACAAADRGAHGSGERDGRDRRRDATAPGGRALRASPPRRPVLGPGHAPVTPRPALAHLARARPGARRASRPGYCPRRPPRARRGAPSSTRRARSRRPRTSTRSERSSMPTRDFAAVDLQSRYPGVGASARPRSAAGARARAGQRRLLHRGAGPPR